MSKFQETKTYKCIKGFSNHMKKSKTIICKQCNAHIKGLGNCDIIVKTCPNCGSKL